MRNKILFGSLISLAFLIGVGVAQAYDTIGASYSKNLHGLVLKVVDVSNINETRDYRLPALSPSNDGDIYIVKRIGTSDVRVVPAVGEYMDGEYQGEVNITGPKGSAMVVADYDSQNWWSVGLDI